MGLDVVILGSGGHGRALLDCLKAVHPDWNYAFLDADSNVQGQMILSCPVLGDDGLLPELLCKNNELKFVVGVGAVAPDGMRKRVYEYAISVGLSVFSVIHPASTVSPFAQIDSGAQIMAGTVVGTSARIGKNAILNSMSIVEHDCVIGDHAHIASGACLAGNVLVGEGAMIGVGATVRQSVKIGAGAMVGAGAVVIRDVPDQTTVVGVPAK